MCLRGLLGGLLTPCAHNMVLGDRENDVAVGVVFDLRERTLVSGEKNRPHVCGVSGRRGRFEGWAEAFVVAVTLERPSLNCSSLWDAMC